MEYKDFLCATVFRLTNEIGDKADIDIYESLKNNGNLRKGIIIREKDKNIGPIIYMEEFYERFNSGVSLDRIVNDVLGFYKKVRFNDNWKCDQIMEYQHIKDKLAVKLINYNKNKEYLRNYPHIRYLDLSIIFYVVLGMKDDGMATVVVTYDYMERWGISKAELLDQAVSNSCKILPAKFSSMQDMLEELMNDANIRDDIKDENKEIMYVLTNEHRNCGAACILYRGVLEMIGDILNKNFFIIPSSIHEVLIVPADRGVNPANIDRIIDDVNEKYLSREELLGNHCYIYDRITKEVSFGYEWPEPLYNKTLL